MESALQRFLFGHFHMWFVQTLAGFYLLIPIGRQICANKKVLQYYLLLWLIFRFILPQLTALLELNTISAWINSFARLDILVGYFGYFLLGYYLNEVDIVKWVRRFIYALGFGGCGLTIFMTIGESRAAGTYLSDWTSPGAVNVLLMSVSIFVFFKYHGPDGCKRGSFWVKISGYTFFIYMFHMFVIEKLNLIGITVISFSPVLFAPVMTVFVFSVSLLGAFVADHIPIIKKMLLY